MKIVHLVICNDCGNPAYEMERNEYMCKYYCKHCNLIFRRYDMEYILSRKEF